MLANSLKIIIPAAVLLTWAAVFTVDERQEAILFQFGEIIESDYEPGLHVKIPFINNVRKFDNRILTIDQKPERFLTQEKKDLIVDSYVKWRIIDVVQYYKTTQGDELTAGRLLYENINNGLRDEFGKRSIQEIVSGDRAQIMSLMTQQASERASSLGIEVVDVRVKKVDYPERVSNSVYQRMRAEREREARDFRSKGHEASERIQADADRQRSVLLAEAYRDSEIARGEGDARATEIYAQAFNKDQEFYKFTRSLTAYKKTFSNAGDVILLEPDSEYFRYFKDPTGKMKK
ncbi:MAG: protease modulator HflC [Gammaproteobacteria bacterium]|nr:protease modulator HflC [Gammaproteobacteria bacterium]MCK4833554.1 protease modulator HflC [Gammaproteobacteria bacterium]